MFENDFTRKMPCWSCTKYKDNDNSSCPILKTVMDMFVASAELGVSFRKTAEEISGLTFDCSAFDQKHDDEYFYGHRIFPKFNTAVNCPLCDTNEDKPCVLIPIQGTQDGMNVEAKPIHLDCIIDKDHDYTYNSLLKVLEKIR